MRNTNEEHPNGVSRGQLLTSGSGILAAVSLSHLVGCGTTGSGTPAKSNNPLTPPEKGTMNTISCADGTRLYYKGWGSGHPVVFSHGWPLTTDAWDSQMMFLASKGYRVIAHDRRGHGRSEQSWNGNDRDTYAAPHGMCVTHADQINSELLAFLEAGQ